MKIATLEDFVGQLNQTIEEDPTGAQLLKDPSISGGVQIPGVKNTYLTARKRHISGGKAHNYPEDSYLFVLGEPQDVFDIFKPAFYDGTRRTEQDSRVLLNDIHKEKYCLLGPKIFAEDNYSKDEVVPIEKCFVEHGDELISWSFASGEGGHTSRYTKDRTLINETVMTDVAARVVRGLPRNVGARKRQPLFNVSLDPIIKIHHGEGHIFWRFNDHAKGREPTLLHAGSSFEHESDPLKSDVERDFCSYVALTTGSSFKPEYIEWLVESEVLKLNEENRVCTNDREEITRLQLNSARLMWKKILDHCNSAGVPGILQVSEDICYPNQSALEVLLGEKET